MGLSGQLHVQAALTSEKFLMPVLQGIKLTPEDFPNFRRGEFFFHPTVSIPAPDISTQNLQTKSAKLRGYCMDKCVTPN